MVLFPVSERERGAKVWQAGRAGFRPAPFHIKCTQVHLMHKTAQHWDNFAESSISFRTTFPLLCPPVAKEIPSEMQGSQGFVQEPANPTANPRKHFRTTFNLSKQGRMPLAEYLLDVRTTTKLKSLPLKARGMLAECCCTPHLISRFSSFSLPRWESQQSLNSYCKPAAPMMMDRCFRSKYFRPQTLP